MLILSHALSLQVRDLKSKLQNAVKKGMQVLANDTKENLKKYEQELVAAKIEKEKLQQNLQKLTKDIENVSEELKSMGVKGQDTLELLCKQLIYLLCFSLLLFSFLFSSSILLSPERYCSKNSKWGGLENF